MDGRILSVSEVTELLKRCLEAVPFFQNISVKGEISNLKRYASGAFFDLKDEKSPLPCVFFASEGDYRNFKANNGEQYVLTGRLGVWPKAGRYQLYVREAEPEGAGLLAKLREELKQKLAKEGLFDEARKRPLPQFPKRIGVVTAHGSAAEADIVTNLNRRYPIVDIVIIPATVQGASAPASIIKGIEKAQGLNLDILVIARGGGSAEDLAAFDDEKVVRAIAASKVPTVTAIGHEIDFTLADFASDKRVSTPTAAAAQLVPDIADIKSFILGSEAEIASTADRKIGLLKEKLMGLAGRSYFEKPETVYALSLEKTNGLIRRMLAGAATTLERLKEKEKSLMESLTHLDPGQVISRGYALAYIDGKLVKDPKDAPVGAKMETRVKGGIIASRVLGGD